MQCYRAPKADELNNRWQTDPRWKGSRRDYTAKDVTGLRGSVHIESTLARRGAERLWQLLHTEPFVPALGALTGNQAIQMVAAGLKAIYLSGWQVAADANLAGQMYPDQSLYPCNSAPTRSSTPRGVTRSTTSPRSSPTPRPVSAARSMRSRS